MEAATQVQSTLVELAAAEIRREAAHLRGDDVPFRQHFDAFVAECRARTAEIRVRREACAPRLIGVV